MQQHVYYNGSLIQDSAVSLSPFNRGLHYGDGVFETMRAYAGMIFRFEANQALFCNDADSNIMNYNNI